MCLSKSYLRGSLHAVTLALKLRGARKKSLNANTWINIYWLAVSTAHHDSRSSRPIINISPHLHKLHIHTLSLPHQNHQTTHISNHGQRRKSSFQARPQTGRRSCRQISAEIRTFLFSLCHSQLQSKLKSSTEPRSQEHQVQDLLPGFPVHRQAPGARGARQQQAQQEVRGLLPCCCLRGHFRGFIMRG